MPVVPGGVVDENADRAEIGLDGRNRAFDRADITQIRMVEDDRMGGICRKPGCQRLAGFLGYVDEGDLCALLGKGFHQACADAGAAAGDEDGAIFQIGKLRLSTHRDISSLN